MSTSVAEGNHTVKIKVGNKLLQSQLPGSSTCNLVTQQLQFVARQDL